MRFSPGWTGPIGIVPTSSRLSDHRLAFEQPPRRPAVRRTRAARRLTGVTAPLEGKRVMEERVLELFSARKGHFLLESGHHGDLWLDLENLFRRPALIKSMAAQPLYRSRL